MIGVPIIDPNTPPLVMVNVPPAISSRVIAFTFALFARLASSYITTSQSITFETVEIESEVKSTYLFNACIVKILAVSKYWHH